MRAVSPMGPITGLPETRAHGSASILAENEGTAMRRVFNFLIRFFRVDPVFTDPCPCVRQARAGFTRYGWPYPWRGRVR